MTSLQSVDWGLVAPLIVIHFILLVIALVDCLRSSRVNGPKWMWILIILFINLVGPVLYFLLGRKKD